MAWLVLAVGLNLPKCLIITCRLREVHTPLFTGDSGGPLLIPDHENLNLHNGKPRYDTILGITSFGPDCHEEQSAGVYTDISFFQQWIRNVINGEVTNLAGIIVHCLTSLTILLPMSF